MALANSKSMIGIGTKFECLLNRHFANFQPVSCKILRNQQEKKKNSQLVFASWPLRRRTDEEIIRLCTYGLLQ
jgi:hypothetical protein